MKDESNSFREAVLTSTYPKDRDFPTRFEKLNGTGYEKAKSNRYVAQLRTLPEEIAGFTSGAWIEI